MMRISVANTKVKSKFPALLFPDKLALLPSLLNMLTALLLPLLYLDKLYVKISTVLSQWTLQGVSKVSCWEAP